MTQMKTIRLTEHWQERDSGQGSVSNPSHHSNNNSTSNLHAQQIGNMMPVSTSVSNMERTAANPANAAIVLAGGCLPAVNNITVNQVAIHQQQPQSQHHESGHDHLCNRKKYFIIVVLLSKLQVSSNNKTVIYTN